MTPQPRFRTVLIDPPWPARGSGKIKRGAQRHYPLLKLDEMELTIRGCPHWAELHYCAHCYLWTTNTYVMAAGALLEDLGFRYITKVTWAKKHAGIGQYFRGQTEDLLFGVRGPGKHPSVCTDRRDLPTLVIADHVRDARGCRVHSAKPEVFRELVEKRSKGPYLELFARTQRPGWTAWGNADDLLT